MLGYDVYPKLFMPKAGVRVEPGLCTAYYACELRKRCLADNKLMFFVPVANVQNPGRTPVGMDKTRMLCQARTALIYGAKSLLYFALECVCGDEAWDALRIISAQTRAMAPALLNGDIEQRVSYTPGEFKPAEGIFPMVNAAVFRYPDGKYLLLAANIMPHAVETVFTVKGLRKAEKLFDAGDKTSSITLREESFTEKIGPYGALACLLGLAEPEPVSVSVAMTALEKEKAPAVDVAGIIRQLRMSPDGNCCPNPCFKERFVKGIPDFYRPYFCVNTDFGAGKKGSTCYVDDETLWNGNPSLKMTKTEPEKTRGMFGIFYPPGKTGKMTFSFYAKGETGTESVEFLILSKVRKSFKLARDWTRCHVTFDTPANECEYLIIPGKGSVWISGLQCGRGETPSEFRDDSVLREVKVTEDPDNLLKNGHAEYGDTRGWTAPPALSDKFITKDARNGVFAFKMTPGPALSLLSGEPLPVDQRASYELYGAFKSQSGATRLNFGLILHDSEKRVIRAENVFPVRGTETELAAPCAADDKTIKVKDAASWKAGCRLAFETDKGLPNFNVSGVAIDSVHRTGGDWFVKLRGPCGFAYPAGTKVAEHRDGAGGIFPCSAEIPESWTELKGKIGPSDFKKWPGAKFVSVTIIPKLNSPGAGLLADDISLKKIP
jgi:hypothetical protein